MVSSVIIKELIRISTQPAAPMERPVQREGHEDAVPMKAASRITKMPCKRTSSTLKKKDMLRLMTAPATSTNPSAERSNHDTVGGDCGPGFSCSTSAAAAAMAVAHPGGVLFAP